MLARFRVARILHRYLAQRGRKSNWARAMEAGRSILVLHGAGAVVLAARTGARVARIRILAKVTNVARRATAETKWRLHED